MIVRDNANPRGRIEEQPRSLFTLGTRLDFLFDEASSWRDSDEVFARRALAREVAREEKVARGTVVANAIAPTLQVRCQGPGCSTVFTTQNLRRIYCSRACIDKAHRARNAKPKPQRERVIPLCHPERRHVARGMCRPCYNADWLRRNDRLLA